MRKAILTRTATWVFSLKPYDLIPPRAEKTPHNRQKDLRIATATLVISYMWRCLMCVRFGWWLISCTFYRWSQRVDLQKSRPLCGFATRRRKGRARLSADSDPTVGEVDDDLARPWSKELAKHVTKGPSEGRFFSLKLPGWITTYAIYWQNKRTLKYTQVWLKKFAIDNVCLTPNWFELFTLAALPRRDPVACSRYEEWVGLGWLTRRTRDCCMDLKYSGTQSNGNLRA